MSQGARAPGCGAECRAQRAATFPLRPGGPPSSKWLTNYSSLSMYSGGQDLGRDPECRAPAVQVSLPRHSGLAFSGLSPGLASSPKYLDVPLRGHGGAYRTLPVALAPPRRNGPNEAM